MFIVSSNFYIYSWVSFLTLGSLISFFFWVASVINGTSWELTMEVFPFSILSFSVPFTFDSYSLIFSSLVCLISSVVFLFSLTYFSSYVKISYFIWLTFSFVLSMLVLINTSDLFFVILGWDGLGIVSFFLILYYQSPLSLFSSLFTLLMNRLGDCLFVILISLSFYQSFSSSFFVFSFDSTQQALPLIIAFTFFTKSAIFPFSPWLPAAMAAPTPISSLVHSSTLVTAGLYLLIRNYSFLYSFPEVPLILTLLGLFTSFYAGLCSLVETDLKNVVALSTLSHLGFICFSLGLGWVSLAFFHLLTHALFKSSLFMALGVVISSSYHYQDSRYFSGILSTHPLISSVIMLSEANLMGLPFLSGFYSNDFVLESFSYSPLSSFLTLIVYCNLFFTFSYSLRVFSSLVVTPIFSSLLLGSNPSRPFFLALMGLSAISVVFGFVYSSFIFFNCFQVPLLVNLSAPLVLVGVSTAYFFSLSSFPSFSYFLVNIPMQFFSFIIFLSPVWSNLSSRIFVSFSFLIQRSVEYGGLYHSVVSSLSSLSILSGSFLSYLYTSNYRLSSFYLVFVFCAFILFLL